MKDQTCKNCAFSFSGNYCPNCGEKVYTEKDRSVRILLKETVLLLTQFEGTFFSTVKAIFLNPGKLSSDYCLGIRKRYFKPISFYLLVVVIYLLFPLFQGLNMQMNTYKYHAIIGSYASQQIENKAKEYSISESTLAERYAAKSETSSKLLLLLLIPFSALVVALLYLKRKSKWFDLLILATEMNIFYLLVIFLLLPLLYVYLLQNTGILRLSEDALGLSFTLLFGIYAAIVFRNIFKSTWMVSILKGFTFGLLHTLIVLMIYKPLVFVFTILLL